MPNLIYIHGFNSSDKSHKAELIKARCIEKNCADSFISPCLSWEPKQAILELEALIEDCLPTGVTLCASSLGGYYATYLAEKYDIKCVLVNPAVAAYELLEQHLGEQFNPYTMEYYTLTKDHMQQLLDIEVASIKQSLYWLLLQEGDEVLNFQKAVNKYPNVDRILEEGGNHRFENFERYIDKILAFSNLLPANAS